MSAAEIKQTKISLIAWIEQLSDANMLLFLQGIKDSRSERDWWDNLSGAQIDKINEGLKEARENKVITSAEFWNKLKNA